MDNRDEFLWGGLRARLEQTGKVRPHSKQLRAASWAPTEPRPKRARKTTAVAGLAHAR